ncbi:MULTISPECIES: DMT family transporter [unclassified Modestobacter]|uniref:DMT family transporter n=1 Tax=unclassified Modestobacter TaxID=2643866 RepID=UPI0022AA379D|nr:MULTISPECIES: DMT family transporter [unclassified Modestobacter]MCZ2824173.1 DMT family transporter [Modestobacter sp. VKM Ac-2981]MCZ2854299.1 DMT family transporter [Modestobacter sp. VKM Ac-2982]
MTDPAAPPRSPARGVGAAAPSVSPWAVHRPGGREVGLMAVAVIGVSFSGPLTAMVATSFLAIAFWRNAAGAVLLLPVLLLRERATLTGLRARQLVSSVVAGLFLAAHFAAWLPSLSMTTVAASTALVTTTPIWTALAARFTGVHLPRQVWWGLALAVFGAALIAGVDVTVSWTALAGDGLALLGAICAGGYMLAGARARERLTTSAYAVVCYSTCAVVLALAALVVGVPLAGFSARDWWLIAAITVCAQLFGHTLLNLVLSSVGPTVVGLAVLLEVPGALLVALVLLQQVPPLLALPGMIAVVIGVALVIRGGRPTPEADPV